jgi:uncharacterized protein (DUF1778 family)
MQQSSSPSILSVRVSSNERLLLEAAAEQSKTSLSDFIRRKAIEAAEADIFEHPLVAIPADAWEKFETWAKAPAKDIPALTRLAKTRPVWQT